MRRCCRSRHPPVSSRPEAARSRRRSLVRSRYGARPQPRAGLPALHIALCTPSSVRRSWCPASRLRSGPRHQGLGCHWGSCSSPLGRTCRVPGGATGRMTRSSRRGLSWGGYSDGSTKDKYLGQIQSRIAAANHTRQPNVESVMAACVRMVVSSSSTHRHRLDPVCWGWKRPGGVVHIWRESVLRIPSRKPHALPKSALEGVRRFSTRIKSVAPFSGKSNPPSKDRRVVCVDIVLIVPRERRRCGVAHVIAVERACVVRRALSRARQTPRLRAERVVPARYNTQKCTIVSVMSRWCYRMSSLDLR